MKIPKHIQKVISQQEVHTLATSTLKGTPNIIYLTFLKVYNDEQILIANNKFSKTEKNLLQNPKIAFVVFDQENRKAYQLKGDVGIHQHDKIYQDAAEWVKAARPDMDPPKAGVILNVKEIYCGSEKIAEA